MKIVEPEFEVWFPETKEDAVKMLKRVERAGRVSYKSEDKITDDSYAKFIRNVVNLGHLSVIEHAVVTAKLTVDRGVTHELVRHRLASFTQESTRWINYSSGRFGSEIKVIEPSEVAANPAWHAVWEKTMLADEAGYMELLALGCPVQLSRSVLPTGLKAEIVVTANVREWRWIFDVRTAKDAHPQIIQIMKVGLVKLYELMPVIFEDEMQAADLLKAGKA